MTALSHPMNKPNTRGEQPQHTPDSLTASEYLRLRDWFSDEKRKPANLAFTAGAARDAASAFELSLARVPHPSLVSQVEKLRGALKHSQRSLDTCYRHFRHCASQGLAERLIQESMAENAPLLAEVGESTKP